MGVRTSRYEIHVQIREIEGEPHDDNFRARSIHEFVIESHYLEHAQEQLRERVNQERWSEMFKPPYGQQWKMKESKMSEKTFNIEDIRVRIDSIYGQLGPVKTMLFDAGIALSDIVLIRERHEELRKDFNRLLEEKGDIEQDLIDVRKKLVITEAIAKTATNDRLDWIRHTATEILLDDKNNIASTPQGSMLIATAIYDGVK